MRTDGQKLMASGKRDPCLKIAGDFINQGLLSPPFPHHLTLHLLGSSLICPQLHPHLDTKFH